ncbi:diacylglycerol kinase family protein [uncultured Bacteroides sp.]|uniref:diacylglycerol/lipid kinase family protein n=1 Tax=uncultured Bacteroides sp. TaxID=162156 RepID=UPI002AAAE23A|nr:diacylglycerol kinase family protein [uncultured Bacteroides sp.]
MNEKKKILFVVNPISGTQNKKFILNQIQSRIDQNKYEIEVKYTERAGHAKEIASQAASMGVYCVTAIGGDGTINEIARSLVHTDTVLGIIPCGSGNGLARHLQIPMDTRRAIDIINRGEISIIDYGKINDKPFFCTCGVGFDAFVSLKFAAAGRRGILTYLEKTLHECLNYKPETYEVESDDAKTKYKAFLIACGNASQYGNNAYIAPQASLQDGLMNVTILEPFTVLDIPSLAFQLFNKTLNQNSRIKTFKSKKIHIHRTNPGVVHYDGDPVMMNEDIDIEIIAKGLKVIVPKKGTKELNVLQKAYDYFGGLKPRGENLVEDLAQKNRQIIDRNIDFFRRLTKK